MITNLKEVIRLVESLNTVSLPIYSKLWDITNKLSEEDYGNCRVRVQSVASLGLDDQRDFFLVKGRRGGWVLIKTSVHGVGVGNSDVPNAIYIQHEGRYAFVVGDFRNELVEDSRGVPPL